jgi:hypothetical protein
MCNKKSIILSWGACFGAKTLSLGHKSMNMQDGQSMKAADTGTLY